MSSEIGITNIDIEKFFSNETNDNLQRNFMGVCSSDSITKYINFLRHNKSKISICNFQHGQRK